MAGRLRETFFETFGTVASFAKESIVQLHDVKANLLRQQFDLPGAAHIMAISNHGGFVLLLRIQISEKKNTARSATLPLQQATIGIWDCHEQIFTQLLILDSHFSVKRQSWNFSHYVFTPCFAPEAKEDSDVNRVLLYAPPGWKLTKNISPIMSLDHREGHLLLFEAKRSTSPRKKFGKYLMLKLHISTTCLRFVLKHLVLPVNM
jgi:hypothetical protein